MKKIAALICLMLPAIPVLGIDAFPMTTVAELGTAVG
jgi:hypothetical protein